MSRNPKIRGDRVGTGLESMVSEPTVPEDWRAYPAEGQDFWVFGYGSLMWHPGFPHLEVRPARLHGYHRRFCVYSHHYRGTLGCPGLVLGLDLGGSCRGLAYRVPAGERDEVLDYLHEREMLTNVYRPCWLGMQTALGAVTAVAFVVDRQHHQYTGRLSADEVADLILQGDGQRGSCLEYLQNTVRHLDALGLSDQPLRQLLARVSTRQKV